MSNIIEVLTIEQDDLKRELEVIIVGELQTIDNSILSLSRALEEYRNEKLYRDEYKTFAECAARKFGIGRSRAQQLIAGGNTITALEGCCLPKGYEETPTEGQIRPLSKKNIPDELKREVYTAAAQEAAGKGEKLTGATVSRQLQKVQDEPPARKQKPRRKAHILLLERMLVILSTGKQCLHNAIINNDDYSLWGSENDDLDDLERIYRSIMEYLEKSSSEETGN